jgi:hypothetical protein
MATLSNAQIGVSFAALLASQLDLRDVQDKLAVSPNYAFANGTGANQANQTFADIRTLSASASENLDLAGGLVDAFGATITMTKVKAILIMAAASNTNDVLVGGAASNAAAAFFGDATDVVKIKPGGLILLVAPDAAGYAITAGTGDLLKIANGAGGTSVTYTIAILATV